MHFFIKSKKMSLIELNIIRAEKLITSKQNFEAEQIYKSILKKFPNNLRAKQGLEKLYYKNGDNKETSDEILKKLVILYDSENSDELIKLGKKYLDHYEKQSHLIYNLIGVAFSKTNNHKEAFIHFKNAILIKPDYYEAYFNLGNLLYSKGKFKFARNIYYKAIQFKHNYYQAYNNLGMVYKNINNIEKAIENYNKSISINSEFYSPYNNLGKIFLEKKDYKKAHLNFIKSIKLLTKNKDFEFKNLIFKKNGIFYNNDEISGRFPQLSELLTNLSISQISFGKFKDGWINYKSRLYSKEFILKNDFINLPSFNIGDKNKKLIIWPEQGIGDQILFSRFLKQLNYKKNNIFSFVNKKLKPIFEDSFPNITFINETDKKIFDSQMPMGELPSYFISSFKDVKLSSGKYLSCDKNLTKSFRSELPKNKLVCGLSWESKNFNNGDVDKNIQKKNNSTTLESLKDILAHPDMVFVDLQYTNTELEKKLMYEKYGLKIHKFNEVDNFYDLKSLSSIINLCDIVLTIPNVTAHLAGSLGIKTFLILENQNLPTWYWNFENNTSFWYNSIRKFQKPLFLSEINKKITQR